PSNGSFSSCGAVVYFSAPGCAWWVNPWKRVKTPILDAIADAAPDADVTYSGNSDEANPFRPYTDQEIADAVDAAAKAEVAIVVVHQMAGEDGDLKSLSLSNAGTMANPFAKVPNNQDMLVQRVAAANRNTIVIVESGNPVLMPWIGKVSAVLQAWYPGENGGKAIANILFGKVNPSGRLPVTFPVSDDQTPTLGKDFIPDPDYAEKLGVGYRWYDANRLQPLFEFGYGLSYTDFAYSGLRVDSASDGTRTVSFSVKNTGKVAGKETPQVYIEFPASAGEPPRRLAGWDKVDLQPGASKTVSMRISPKMQSIWDSAASQWKFVGASKVLVGASSRQMKLEL
ncbi:MAG: glycoside hydrolase family 3 C-terminal domain-containing protein, partial [Phyllobacterium sp.]